MGESNWVYAITHYDKSNSWQSADITGDTIDLKFDDVVNEVPTAMIILDCDGGHYMRDQRAGESGYPTKIDKFDRIRIISDDGSGVTTDYNEVFDVIRKVPVKSEEGTYIEFKLKHIGRWLEDGVPFTGRGTFENPAQMWENIGEYYNDNRGTDQPVLTGHKLTDTTTNTLPQGIIEHYDFGNNEEKPFERFRQISDQQGAPGANGGILDVFNFKVNASVANVTSVVIKNFSSGSPSVGSEVTINTSLDAAVNSGETDGGEEEPRGNIIFAWGSNDGGTLPIDYSRFKGRQILMPSPATAVFAEWVAGTYESGAIVKRAGVVYQANAQTTQTPNDTEWDILTTAAYYGNVIQYSPWTDDKVTLWENSGGDPGNAFSGNYGQTMPDINIIINDDTTFGTWADVSSTTDAFNVFWKYGEVSGGNYEGLRCLVNGTGTAGFSGNDAEGRAFTNSIAEYTDGAWHVKYSAIDDMFCYVFDEGRNYQYDITPTAAWNNVTLLDNGSHNTHPYTALENSVSVLTDEDGSEYSTTNANSSIRATYEWEPTLMLAQDATSTRTDSNYFEAGAWLCLRWPFPKNTYNSISENLGQIYGGGAADWVTSTSYVINDKVQESGLVYRCILAHTSGTFATDLAASRWTLDNKKAPSHIDTQNMTFTHDGNRGFNFGTSSNDYGPLSAVSFFMKIVYNDRTTATTVELPKGNFKIRCWAIDQSDHVVFQDFVVSHGGNWQSVSLPLSGFQIYRGRRPRFNDSIIPINDLIVPRGLDAQEQFEWRHVAMMGWQTQESYDDFGRYAAGRGDFGIINIFTFTNRRLRMSIDGLRFTKPLLVNTGNITDNPKVVLPFVEEKGVVVYDQLEGIAYGEREKAQFERASYEIETSIRHDISAGDFFYLLDSEIVDKTDNSTDNNILMVALSVEYYIKGDGVDGGATRLIKAARRFT